MAAKYSEELFNKICEEIATSSRGLYHICKDNKISTVSFYKWLLDDEETVDKILINKYTRAREAQADFMADEIIEIADDDSKDTITKVFGEEIVEVENKEWVNRSKLRVEARKWLAMKLKPKKYGDKIDLTSGDKPLPPTTVTVFKLPDNGRDEKSDK